MATMIVEKQNLDELASDRKRHKNELNSRCSLKVTKNTEAQKAKKANSSKEFINWQISVKKHQKKSLLDLKSR